MISTDLLDAMSTTVFHEFADEDEAFGASLFDFVVGLDDQNAQRLVESLTDLAGAEPGQRGAILEGLAFAWDFPLDEQAGFFADLAEVVSAIREEAALQG
jgi:23S rRNA G2069 N7-methylase RlmK/C1962 C5-methylase RlmI